MSVFTKSQMEKIRQNLDAYEANFSYLRIEKADYGNGFFIYKDDTGDYIQYCYNIDYLNGWLYGAVQAKCGVMKNTEIR